MGSAALAARRCGEGRHESLTQTLREVRSAAVASPITSEACRVRRRRLLLSLLLSLLLFYTSEACMGGCCCCCGRGLQPRRGEIDNGVAFGRGEKVRDLEDERDERERAHRPRARPFAVVDAHFPRETDAHAVPPWERGGRAVGGVGERGCELVVELGCVGAVL